MPTPFLHRIVSAMLLAAAVGVTPVHADAPRSVDVKQAQQMNAKGALLLDVREPHEYASGHAPGSKLIPVGQLSQRLKEIDAYRDKPVVLICRSGRRSEAATEILQKAGFTAATNVEGGMIAWEKAGMPIVQGAK